MAAELRELPNVLENFHAGAGTRSFQQQSARASKKWCLRDETATEDILRGLTGLHATALRSGYALTLRQNSFRMSSGRLARATDSIRYPALPVLA